jgi:hypothetical protein
MTPLVTPPPLLKPAAPPPRPGSIEGARGDQARFAVPEEAPPSQVPPTAAALAAMTAMGGKPAVASRLEARRIARRREERKDGATDETIDEAPAPTADLPPVLPLIGRPRIDLEAELAAARNARRPPRGVGPLTAFLAQQFGQSGGFAASLTAPLKWLIEAYMRHQAPARPAPKPRTLTVS